MEFLTNKQMAEQALEEALQAADNLKQQIGAALAASRAHEPITANGLTVRARETCSQVSRYLTEAGHHVLSAD